MSRALFLLVGLILLLGACTQRMICPAYQSAFIHDQAALSRRVSYFKDDSTPKIITVSKNKYLILPEQSYRKKIRSMQTVQMKSIHPVLPDSLTKKEEAPLVGAESDSVVTAPADSLSKDKKGKDSTYMISKDREVYLVRYRMDSDRYVVDTLMYTSDQDNYMWYFRDVLVLPDVRAALMEKKNKKDATLAAADAKDSKAKKKGIGGFFKGLFKKKQKPDSTAIPPPPVDDGLPPDSTTLANTPVAVDQQQPVKKEKKGLGGLFKKKVKDAKKVEPPVVPADKKDPKKDPTKKEDDGF